MWVTWAICSGHLAILSTHNDFTLFKFGTHEISYLLIFMLVGYLWTLKCSIAISMLQAPSSNLHTFPPSWFSISSITSSSYKSLVVFMNCFKIASLVLPSFHLHIHFLVCKNNSFQLTYQTFFIEFHFLPSWNDICCEIKFV